LLSSITNYFACEIICHTEVSVKTLELRWKWHKLLFYYSINIQYWLR